MNKWDKRFTDLAMHVAGWSKDPSTQVGAVIVGPDKEVLSVGYNGFPRGMNDSEERLNDRPLKYALTVHAERNAILNAARYGISLKGSTLYVIATSGGKYWGGAPCQACSIEVAQAGISQVVAPTPHGMPDRWRASCHEGAEVLRECGIIYREFEYA